MCGIAELVLSFLDFLLATCEQLPDYHSRLLSSSSAIGCPMWLLLQWLQKFLSIGLNLRPAHLTMCPWSMLLWSKLRSPVYQMHPWIGSGLLRFANLLGASDWLHSILEGSRATIECLPWHRLLELYGGVTFWLRCRDLSVSSRRCDRLG